jgi:uncharacterized Zn finger protein
MSNRFPPACCPSCGKLMRLLRTIYMQNEHPAVGIYECKKCGVVSSEAIETEVLEGSPLVILPPLRRHLGHPK